MEKVYTIICVDVDKNDDSPILVQDYGLMAMEQALTKMEEIYQEEKKTKEDNGGEYNIDKTDNYIGVHFDLDYSGELSRREYYLRKLEVK